MAKIKLLLCLKRLLQGALIGAGGILPGISGGVLCVLFGRYFPIMETFTHPIEGVKKHWRLLLPVGLGGLAGFVGGGKLIALIFGANDTVATWLFLGLIAGTLPALWREAGKQGRSAKSLRAMTAAFLLFGALLFYVRFGTLQPMAPDFADFLFCGVLWGLSIIIPGMISSSILMAADLFEPLAAGISCLDPGVVIPWLIGMGVVVLSLSRLVMHLFDAHYALIYHMICGIILASTLSIVPFAYASAAEALMSAACFGAGCLMGYLGEGRQK